MNILVLFFDPLMRIILRDRINQFPREFFLSHIWPSRPNSTSRLSIANFQALKLLEDNFNFEFLHCDEIGDDYVDSLLKYDLVIVNQAPSKASHEFIRKFIKILIEYDLGHKVIFGTEVTWFNELRKGVFSQAQVNYVYYQSNRLLRHTAKTDREIYARNFIEPNITEFELGIDTSVVKASRDITERRKILFVKAPPGRVTKNNEKIALIQRAISRSRVLSGYDVSVLTPPYSSVQYWEILQDTAFLIFVSDSETFSYVLNDAKAAGVITYFPSHMYANTIGRQFSLQSYPESDIRYHNIEDLVENLERIATDEYKLRVESRKSRLFVEENLSIESIAENWKKVLTGKSLASANAYLFSGMYDLFTDFGSFAEFCRTNNIRHIIIRDDPIKLFPQLNDFCFFDEGKGLIFHKYLYEFSGSIITRSVNIENGYSEFRNGERVEAEKDDEVIRFVYLFKRLNKINKVFANVEFCSANSYGKIFAPAPSAEQEGVMTTTPIF